MAIQAALEGLPTYGVFEFLAFSIDRGKVTLSGYSYNGTLKSQAAKAVTQIRGVDEVENLIEDLPRSSFDDQIRWATFSRIYGDPSLSRYSPGGTGGAYDAAQSSRFPGMQPVGAYPIRIIVKNGRTLLVGSVASEVDKRMAALRAGDVGGVIAVDNKLVVDKD